MSDFKYSSEEINQMIEDNGLQKVCMQGVYNDLQKLKPVIEEIYDKHIFYLSYWKNECGYHGWDWNEDDGKMKNQAEITDGITKRFKEIYTLILSGLGEKCEDNKVELNEICNKM